MNVEARYLGKYQLLECIARGGMGEVWKALDEQLQRYVAIKLLHANLKEDPNFIVRFEREAQLIAHKDGLPFDLVYLGSSYNKGAVQLYEPGPLL